MNGAIRANWDVGYLSLLPDSVIKIVIQPWLFSHEYPWGTVITAAGLDCWLMVRPVFRFRGRHSLS